MFVHRSHDWRRRVRRGRFTPLVLILIGTAACGGDTTPVSPSPPLSPPTAPAQPPIPPRIVADAILVGAGDVGMCGVPEVEATARLLEGIPGTVFAAGDLAYPAGSATDYANCYDPSWGRVRHRTRPAPGNHDYDTQRGEPYYTYFGDNAGPAGQGYYSYRAGGWLVLSLNSNIPASDGSPQAAWVRSTLASNPASCTLAYWHHPLFSSGPNGDNPVMRDVWRILQEAGADVVISGHDHLYERFAPQDATGRSDPRRGLRQFTVGTGGAHMYEPKAIHSNSEVIGRNHGVLKLTLRATSYEWEFVSIPGKPFADFGMGDCHAKSVTAELPIDR